MSALAGRRVLVTGATGFIGRRTAELSRDLGADVHATSRVGEGPVDGVRWHRLDPTDRARLHDVLEVADPDVVLHLSGAAVGRQEIEHLLPTFEANVVSTVLLVEALARRGSGRLVTAGSLEEPAPDDPAPSVSSPYSASKWAATVYARFGHERYGVEWADLRTFMVYGPRQENLAKLIPSTILSAARGVAPVVGSPARAIDWVHVDDVAEAFCAAACAPGAVGRTIDIGSGRAVTVGELVASICRLVDPDVEPELGPTSRVGEVVRVADLTAAAEHLGWQPRVPFEDGLRGTVEWYLDHVAGHQEP